MKLNSKMDNIRFKGRRNMGEARNTSRQSGYKNRDMEKMERTWERAIGFKHLPGIGRPLPEKMLPGFWGHSCPRQPVVSPSTLNASRLVAELGD